MSSLSPCVRLVRALVLLVALVLPAFAGRAAEPDPALAPPGHGWHELTFTATRFTAALTVRLLIEPVLADAEGANRPAAGRADGCAEPVADEQQLTVVLSSRGPGLNNRYEERVCFAPADTSLRARVRRNLEGDPWLKRYCREEAGVRRFRIEPAEAGEEGLAPAAWTERETSFYPFPAELAGCAEVSDPALILLLLARRAVLPEQGLVLCVFGRQHLHRLTLRSVGTESLQPNYTQLAAGRGQTVTEQIDAEVYALASEPLPAPGQAAEPFSLLGLRRDIRIHLHPQSRLPLRVSGTAGLFGTVTLNLEQARVD
jgi:hypothetical protein